MRSLVALTGFALLLLTLPLSAAAQSAVKKFESPEHKISFEYPESWEQVPQPAPAGLLPTDRVDARELLVVQTRGDANTEFSVALYRLAAPVNDENVDKFFDAVRAAVKAQVAKLPDGKVLEVNDILVDDADGQVYSYEFTLNDQLMYAEKTVVVDGVDVVDISQVAKDDEYDDKLDIFEDIFASLQLPWSQ